ncbi:hypothetical protein DVH05_009193 [Phytophthora capsici]|nr:hypothetical protein DVH05_009193 [Phytophthora capsici]
MLLLNCAIIGGGDVISIIIEEWKTVALLKDAIKEKKPIKLNDVDAGDLHLFLAKKDGAWLMSDDLLQMREDGKGERGYMSEELKDPVAKISAKFPSELPDGSIHVLVVVPMDDLERQWEELLSSLAYKGTKRLCSSTGSKWEYQGGKELVEALAKPLVDHYNAWKLGNQDKQSHPLPLVLSGPGTGKSRMLDEMKGLLCEAAMRSEDQVLIDRMNSAYMFRVTFENGTPATGSLLNPDIPEYDISYRMLYQLSTGDKSFGSFTDRLKMFSQQRFRIEDVIDILAELEKIDDVKNMTVILCVDALQQLVNDDAKTCDFYRIIRSICDFLNSSTAFAVCVCSSTIEEPVREALIVSPQKCLYLVPPELHGEDMYLATTL